jgi:hypothetical protein
LRLLAASFAALALEMALIRWLPGQVRVVSYFPNLVLIAAFLGLGLGALGKIRWPLLGGGLALATVGGALGLSRIAFTSSGASEHLWLLYYDLPKNAPVIDNVLLPLGLVFVLVTALFIPLGGEIGWRLEHFRSVRQALNGYAIDLLGSLTGVVVFLGLCALGARPVFWFGAAFAAWLAAASGPAWRRGGLLVLLTSAMAGIQLTDRAQVYSPYYALRVEPIGDAGFVLLANGSLHQQAIDLRSSAPGADLLPLRDIRAGYRYHVDHLAARPQRALVLGAGTGNDAAALLDAGVPEVHVVEIDPAILDLGRRLHPSRPYADPRVILHNADARSFLERTPLRFDLIVFGTLDSMTRLSALSNVRLDNFVYTVESLQAARARLNANGGIALMFMVGRSEIGEHLFAILHRAFGAPPLVYRQNHALFNTMFLAGPGFAHLASDPSLRMRLLESVAGHLTATTDDWPYLYLDRRGIPAFYWMLAAIVLVTALAFLGALNARTRLAIRTGAVDWEMLGFGLAFLLVETALVTELNLLFGAVWRTSGIVFASILLALFASTVISTWRRPNPRWSLLGAIVTLVVIGLLPLRGIAPTGEVARVLFAIAVCGLPVFCAGFAFSDRFASRCDAETAFGWNIVGAVIGGILEFSTMLFGLRAIFVLAAAVYLALFLHLGRKRPGVVSASGQSGG